MTSITTNLGLKTYNTNTDASSVLVYDYVNQVSGSSSNQNLGIIDNFAGETSASILQVSGSISALSETIRNIKSCIIQVVQDATDVDETSGIFYLRIPSEIDGTNLIRAQAFVNTAGITGDTTIQVKNLTKYSGSALSAPITIASEQVVGTPGTIDTNYDDVSTDDQVKIYVVSTATQKPKGLQVILEFEVP